MMHRELRTRVIKVNILNISRMEEYLSFLACFFKTEEDALYIYPIYQKRESKVSLN